MPSRSLQEWQGDASAAFDERKKLWALSTWRNATLTTTSTAPGDTSTRLREPCRRLVNAIADGRIQATTTVEVIQELAHVRARRRGRQDTAAVAGDYAGLLAPLIEVAPADLDRGLRTSAAV